MRQENDRRTGVLERRRGAGWRRAMPCAGEDGLLRAADLAILSVLFLFLVLLPEVGSVREALERRVSFGSLLVFAVCVLLWAVTLRCSGVYGRHGRSSGSNLVRSLLALNASTLVMCAGARTLWTAGDLWGATGRFWLGALMGMTLLRLGLSESAKAGSARSERRAGAGRVLAFRSAAAEPKDAG